MSSKKSSKINWSFSTRKLSIPVNKCIFEETKDHPLKQSHQPIQMLSRESKRSKDGGSSMVDPLSVPIDGLDPLSLIAAEMELNTVDKLTPTFEPSSQIGYVKPWSELRSFILNKFTTSQKLSMTSFLSTNEQKGVAKHCNPVVQHRLEQLDDFEEGSLKEVNQLTPAQYAESISDLNKELVEAWNQDARVKALKIAIQCSKLLVDTSVMQFYPSKFVLITDVLDMFGTLVYERLRSKSEIPIGLKGKDGVNEAATETCRNWFYKIASIRELVPRLYVEAAILKSYSFLQNKEFGDAVSRLTAMVRGIGDPLVAVYARCYLCRIASSVQSLDAAFLQKNLYDFITVYHQLFGPHVRMELNRQKIELTYYLAMYEPALDWILQGISNVASLDLFNDIVSRCGKLRNNGFLLNSILNNFKQTYIASKADHFIDLISLCTGDFPKAVLLISLGECLQEHLVENPSSIRDKVWREILKLQKPAHFMSTVQAWTMFIVKNFQHDVVNNFLDDIINNVGNSGKAFTQQLQSVILTIISNIHDPENIFLMDKLLPTLDLFDNETSKLVVCRKILEIFVNKQNFKITDPITTTALMFVAKILHDSVNALTVEDEKKQIGQLISRMIRLINFGMDFEKQLNFYVEARGTFANIDTVLATLIQSVLNLSWEAGKIVKGEHTKSSGSFVRACAAFCYITIPSISSCITRLRLYLLSAQVALFNQCLGQGDACVKAALNLCLELPSNILHGSETISTEAFLVEYVSNFLSTLIVFPDCPEQGPIYLLRGLINMLSHYKTDDNIQIILKLYLKVIDTLAVLAQPVYPYHIYNVDSNDVFYGSDPKFINEVNKICSVVVDEILTCLKILGASNRYIDQGNFSFNLFSSVILHGNLKSEDMSTFAVNLWILSNKNNALNNKKNAITLDWMKQRYSTSHSPEYQKLLSLVSS